MAMVDVDGLRLVATCLSVCIHQINLKNSYNGFAMMTAPYKIITGVITKSYHTHAGQR